MPSRVPARLSVIATVIIAIGALFPPSPAWASSEPPFDLVFPQETAKTHFSSTFGAQRSGGRRHNGNDLMAPRMTEVYAVADGTIIQVSRSRLSGRYIRIQHVDGWTSHYVHLNNDSPGTDDGSAEWDFTVAPGIEVGREVVAGQLIGWVGDSGNAEWSGTHTHFELRHNGSPINPYRLLREAFERDRASEELLARAIAEGLTRSGSESPAYESEGID